MRLRRIVHPQRLTGSVIIGSVAGATLLAGLLGIAVATAASSAPPYPDSAPLVASGTATFPTSVTTTLGTVPIPAGFTVEQQDAGTVVLRAPRGKGRVTVSVRQQSEGFDASSLQQDLINSDRSLLDPNTQICADDGITAISLPVAGGALVPSTYLPLCVSVVPQSTPAFTGRDYFYAGVAVSGGKTVSIAIEVFASTSDFPGLVDQLRGFAPAVRWNATPVPASIAGP